MKITILTNPSDAERRISRAAIGNPDVSLIGTHVHYKGKRVADYRVVHKGIEVNVTDKPWYITDALIESRLRALFS
ncbi:hypothetical protein L2747_18860 [Shewanella marinintestina]|uniref:hypothetical protein n=1 Tax=Shewanella marinintestina TaxID=190305 RepID=UPI00200CAF70|nr:hypothetical protein [Shewanella marinintestina]MCL1148068.1 hypothetical protein [Shewanella marinintestina]